MNKRERIVCMLVFLLASFGFTASAHSRISHVEYWQSGVAKSAVGDLGALKAADTSGFVQLPAPLISLLKVAKSTRFLQVERFQDDRGVSYVRLHQYLNSSRVLKAQLILQLGKGDVIVSMRGNTIPEDTLAHNFVVDGIKATRTILARDASVSTFEFIEGPVPRFAVSSDGLGVAVWVSSVRYTAASGAEDELRLFVNAENGSVLYSEGLYQRAAQFEIYAAGLSGLGNLILTHDGAQSNSPIHLLWAQALRPTLRKVHNYYEAPPFNRTSYDTMGSPHKAQVFCFLCSGPGYQPSTESVRYPADNSVTNIDIVAHEMTHAVLAFTPELIYQSESGAINEGIADIFAAALDRDVANNEGMHIWKIAEGWDGLPGGFDALRYMYDPSITCPVSNPSATTSCDRDYYPDRFNSPDLPTIDNDYNGVHSNSGIANLGFYLLVKGGTHPQGKTDVNVPAIGFDRAIYIIYHAMTTNMLATADFSALRNATAKSARELYSGEPYVAESVCLAWDAVGLPNDYSECLPPLPTSLAAPQHVQAVPYTQCGWYCDYYQPYDLTWAAVEASGYDVQYDYNFRTYPQLSFEPPYAATTTQTSVPFSVFSDGIVKGKVRACLVASTSVCSNYTNFILPVSR